MNLTIADKKFLKENASRFDLISLIDFLNYKLILENHILYKINFTLENKNNIIDKIDFDEIENKIIMFINHSSFFGINGVLPEFLMEDALFEKNKSFIEFFNIFFHKLFCIYIEIIRKRFLINKNLLYSILFKSLNLRSENNKFFYGFQHLLLNDYESITTLIIILRNILNRNIQIVSNTGKYQNLSENDQFKLDRFCKIGMNKVLGKRFLKPSSKIDIIIVLENSKELDEVISLVNSKEIKNIIDIYLNNRVDYSIYISMIPKNMAVLNKNKEQIIIGKNSYLKSNSDKRILLKVLN